MLTHLTLINFALADHLALDIEQGFNVLTGETGAGKSLLLDALSACLGERTYDGRSLIVPASLINPFLSCFNSNFYAFLLKLCSTHKHF